MPVNNDDLKKLSNADLKIRFHITKSDMVAYYGRKTKAKPQYRPVGFSSRKTIGKKYDEEHRSELDEIKNRLRREKEEMELRDLPLSEVNINTLKKHHLESIICGVNEVLFAIGEPDIAVSGTKDVLKKRLNKDITTPEHRDSFISMVENLEQNVSDKDLKIHARIWYAALRGRVCPECEHGIIADEGDKKICSLCGVII